MCRGLVSLRRCTPGGDVLSLFMWPFARPMLPPVGRPRMVVMPNHNPALMPVAIVIEPHTHRMPNAE